MFLVLPVHHIKPINIILRVYAMPDCTICEFRTTGPLSHTIPCKCKQQFCKSCVQALLPDVENVVSVHPQFTSLIICPECKRKTEYCQVDYHNEDNGGPVVGTDRRSAVTITAGTTAGHWDQEALDSRRRHHKRYAKISNGRTCLSYYPPVK